MVQRTLASSSGSPIVLHLRVTACRITSAALPFRSAQHSSRVAAAKCVAEQHSVGKAPVRLRFLPDDVVTTAEAGDNIVAAAHAAGVFIPTGCNSGSCGMCEMEVRKFCGSADDGTPLVVRTCIAGVPPGYDRLEIAQLDDPIWGTDGWDT